MSVEFAGSEKVTTPNGRGETANPRPVRALHLISGLFYGGGQRVVLDLLNSLPGAGDVDARLWTLGEFDGSPLAGRAEKSLPYDGRYNDPRVLWRTARRLRGELRAAGADILHTHGTDADVIGALAVRGLRTRQVCHLHITPPSQRRGSWKARLRRRLLTALTLRHGAAFIAVSEAVRRQMAEYYRLPLERIVTVRNGVDLGDFTNAAAADEAAGRRIVFGTAARLAPMKGLEHLLEAVARLQAEGIDLELRIAGTGGLRERLEQQAESLEIAARVRFAGQVTDMPAFYRGLDVFVLPSESEGLPLVVLEALAGRRPVVATTVGGTPEVLRNGVEGLLVPPGDAAALAQAMAALARDGQRRRQMGEAGRERVEREFSIERVARDVAQVYGRVLAGTSAKAVSAS